MANTIILKKSSTASSIPAAGSLQPGELAVNLADAKLYTKTVGGTVILVGSGAAGSGTVTSVSASGGTTGLTFTGSPITTSGTLTLGGTMAVANGGTGATTAAGALTNLGAYPATNPSGYITSSGSITGNAATATALQTARTFTIGSTGKTFNGSANVSWTTAEIGAEFQQPLGVPRNNLGDPTVREAALFDAQFTNKTELYDINNLWIETSTDNVTWTALAGLTDDKKRAFLTGDAGTVINIAYGTPYFRIRMRATSYVYLNALYAYWSGSGHSTKVQMFKKHDSGAWTQHTSSTATVSSWPGHLYLPFSTIPWNPTATLGTHWHEIYALFIPTWNATYPLNGISLYRGQFWGGYPSGKRNIYSTNELGGVTFPNTVTATGITGPLTGNATTATTLLTARTINGVSFDGSANITVADATKLPLTGGTMTGAITFAGAQTWPTFNQSTTGNAATASLAANSTLAGGLAISTGVNNVANQIVRTNASGYADFGWINTVSGLASGTPTRVYCSQDAYIRYYSMATFTGYVQAAATGSWGISITGSSASTTGNAATATTLQTARTINGVSFNGSANITVADSTKLPLAGGTMTGAITFAAGQTWPTFNQSTTGTAANVTGTVAVANGGTGATTAATARTNIGAAASGANTDITALDQDVTITATGTIAANTLGYRGLPQNSKTASYTLALSDAGNHISITTGGVIIPANGTVAFPVGSTIVVFNDSGSSQTISITTDTLRLAGTATTGSRTLAQYGLATLVKVTSTSWVATGNVT